MDRLEYIESHRGSLSYVVGKKSDYYLNAWSMEKTKINFAAFFLEAFWFAYRKMYRYAMILATINILVTLISLQFILETDYYFLGSIVTIGIRIFVGYKGNDFYYEHVKRKLEISSYEPMEKDCGTSILAAIGLFILMMIAQAMVEVTFNPILIEEIDINRSINVITKS